jgi:hypothetical protein
MLELLSGTVDISKGQIGRFCTDMNTFIVGAAVGELEFEVEENELTLTVDNMVGEWAVFVPAAAGTGGTGGTGTIGANSTTPSQVTQGKGKGKTSSGNRDDEEEDEDD